MSPDTGAENTPACHAVPPTDPLPGRESLSLRRPCRVSLARVPTSRVGTGVRSFPDRCALSVVPSRGRVGPLVRAVQTAARCARAAVPPYVDSLWSCPGVRRPVSRSAARPDLTGAAQSSRKRRHPRATRAGEPASLPGGWGSGLRPDYPPGPPSREYLAPQIPNERRLCGLASFWKPIL